MCVLSIVVPFWRNTYDLSSIIFNNLYGTRSFDRLMFFWNYFVVFSKFISVKNWHSFEWSPTLNECRLKKVQSRVPFKRMSIFDRNEFWKNNRIISRNVIWSNSLPRPPSTSQPLQLNFYLNSCLKLKLFFTFEKYLK